MKHNEVYLDAMRNLDSILGRRAGDMSIAEASVIGTRVSTAYRILEGSLVVTETELKLVSQNEEVNNK